ncbi:class I SAM-dependent methyltransferase [Glaciecola sp. 1036]|uniref:class I SAM-dependent methyltransferase n=1 Tax=Alteromonadaceae TaxID=72275 RepID=UPI003D0753DD
MSNEQEKAEYDQHENQLDDPGYIRFLSRAINPLLERLPEDTSNLRGLDFGCGPGPALATYLNNHGIDTEKYDPLYFPDNQLLQNTYDFVTCTEVVEHFNSPKQSWLQLFKLLKPNGILVVMTKLVIDQARFANWHYKNDPTHICFYSYKTLSFIAKEANYWVSLVNKDVAIFVAKNESE